MNSEAVEEVEERHPCLTLLSSVGFVFLPT